MRKLVLTLAAMVALADCSRHRNEEIASGQTTTRPLEEAADGS